MQTLSIIAAIYAVQKNRSDLFRVAVPWKDAFEMHLTECNALKKDFPREEKMYSLQRFSAGVNVHVSLKMLPFNDSRDGTQGFSDSCGHH